MGCGNSKDSVATENTITLKKFSISSKSEDIQSVNEANEKENAKDSLGDDNGGAVSEVKAIPEDKELKENNEEIVSKESPNRYFSPRKDDDVDKSEFFSPHHGSEKENLFTHSVKSAEETENGETPIIKEEKVAKETIEGTTSESQVEIMQK